jgi:hypothetical protein
LDQEIKEELKELLKKCISEYMRSEEAAELE